MALFKCFRCKDCCELRRDTTFKPERCIYEERGNDQTAHWVKDDAED